VGVSINLQRIVSLPNIANRAYQSLLLLLGVLGIASLQLVPGQSPPLIGVEVLAVVVVLWAVLNTFEVRSWRSVDPKFAPEFRIHTLEMQLPCLFGFLGATFLLLNSPSAIYWFVPATLLSFLVALNEAWVITVEIMR